MKTCFSKYFAIIMFCGMLLSAFAVGAQSPERVALVIGNGRYADMGELRNARNDAIDMTAALQDIGFSVTSLLDADLIAMEKAVSTFVRQLSNAPNAMGLFYYAGHGIQSNGINYLIPVDARIPEESYLRIRAVPLQALLDELNAAKNRLNIIILDACRDNPYSWSRSGVRGLSVVASQPPGSIIVYATSAGSVAKDGTGRNGVFTAELLKHLKTPGIDVMEIFMRTGSAVQAVTNGAQNPAIYSQFFDKAFLVPAAISVAPAPAPLSQKFYGGVRITTETGGTLYRDGKELESLRDGGQLKIVGQETGRYVFEMRYESGERETKSVLIEPDREIEVSFTWKPVAPTLEKKAGTIVSSMIEMVFVEGGTFTMGSNNLTSSEFPEHRVNVSDFYIGKYEVTQEQFLTVMKKNPSYFKGNPKDYFNRPVESVSWYDAIEFCNKLSMTEGLEQVYQIKGTTVIADFNKNGYRLPTEAEWEFAARDRGKSDTIEAWNRNLNEVSWNGLNSGAMTHPVGLKLPNLLGIYDICGNVSEWCWDWYGNYSNEFQIDPQGPKSGTQKVIRGGSWIVSQGISNLAYRNSGSPKMAWNKVGFRIVRKP